jgi:beta-lactam-binding protein with PASTA domain
VLAQNPSAGTVVSAGSAVTIDVCISPVIS